MDVYLSNAKGRHIHLFKEKSENILEQMKC